MILRESRVTTKGQVTVPTEFPRQIENQVGEELQLESSNDRLLVIVDSENFFDRTSGLFAAYRQTSTLSIDDEREAYERGIAEDAINSMKI